MLLCISSLVLIALASSSIVEGRLATTNRTLQSGSCNGKQLWTMAEVQNYQKDTACLVVLYGTVYDLKNFANVHRGGSFSITRNCGKDATFGFKSLVCIPGVPDHTPGILNMVSDVVVGIVKGGDVDTCNNPNPVTPSTPDFDECTVYDAVQCEDLASMPNSGKWTIGQVQSATTGCVVALYDYVFDLGSAPQTSNDFTPHNPGTLTFVDKHGGGPQSVLNHCNTDMTPVFTNLIGLPGIPDHTKGALNAILGYLVGVIDQSDVDPCVNPPPNPNCGSGDLTYYTMATVQATSTISSCVAVVLGKVYDLVAFAPNHYGGKDEIIEKCRQDITSDFFEKSFHTLNQIGAIQQFQIGVIQNGIADPCGTNYDPNPDPAQYDDNSDDGDDNGGDDSGGDDSGGDDSGGDDNSGSTGGGGGDDNGSGGGGGWASIFADIPCFPGSAMVQEFQQGLIAMNEVKIGDKILVGQDNTYGTVYSFGHKDPQALVKYLQVKTKSGAVIEISKDHLIFVNEKGAIPASNVVVGDHIYKNDHHGNELDIIVSIDDVIRMGAYAPFTSSGTLVVNGVKTSSYISLQQQHAFIRIGHITTGISFHWASHAFQFPHRLWCNHLSPCVDEQYINGISMWATRPYKFAKWYLENENLFISLTIFIPLILWLLVCAFLDIVVNYQYLYAIAIALAYIIYYLNHSQKKSSNNKKQL